MNPVEEFLIKESAMTPEVRSALTMGAISAGTTALAAVGTGAVQSGIQSAKDAVSKSIAFKKMLRDNPDLSKMPGKKARQYFNTMYNLAPELAKDPFASGSWVRKVEEYDYVDPQSLQTLSGIGDRMRSRAAQQALPAFQLAEMGTQAGLSEYSRLKKQKADLQRDAIQHKRKRIDKMVEGIADAAKSHVRDMREDRIRDEDRTIREQERMMDFKSRERHRLEDQMSNLGQEYRKHDVARWQHLHSPKARGIKDETALILI